MTRLVDQNDRRPAASRGFTLVELLVVIGIIALLISILLPALGKARKQSRTVACLSNIQQLIMCQMQYLQDNKNHFSPYYDGGGAPPGAGWQINWMAQITKPDQLDKVRLCPEATDSNPLYESVGNWAGAAYYSWGPSGRAMQYFIYNGATQTFSAEQLAGSYGYNGYLLREDPSGDNAGLCGDPDPPGSHGQAARPQRLQVPTMKYSTEVPMIADSTWPIGWPKETDAVPANLYQPDGPGPNPSINGGASGNWNIFCFARHYMAINVGFVDGHAETVPLPDLWKLRWHAEWNTSVPITDAGTPGTAVNLTTITTTIKSEYKG